MALAGIKAKSQGLVRMKLWRILLFEFVVVLAGVLAAQFLANWYQERKDRDRAAEVRKQLVESMHDAREVGEMRALMAVCLTDRLIDVKNYGEKDAPKNHPVTFQPPPTIGLGTIGLDAESRQMIRKYYGIGDLMALQQIETAGIRANKLIEIEDEAWTILALTHKKKDNPKYEIPVEARIAMAKASRAQGQIYQQFGPLVSRTIAMGAPSHDGTISSLSDENGACAAMLKYSLLDHAAAYKKGELPDGTPISEKVRGFAAGYGAGLVTLRDFGWRYARRKDDIPMSIYGPMPKGWTPKTEGEIKIMEKNEGKAPAATGK
jgi:hypothetical protein